MPRASGREPAPGICDPPELVSDLHFAGNAPRSFAFGPFVLRPEQQLLLKEDLPVRIGGRALDILTVLVERQGEVVDKDTLILRVWPNTYVEETNLKVNVAALRRSLGDAPSSPRFIATVVGRGYRFIAPVRFTSLPDLHRWPSTEAPSVAQLIESIDAALQQLARHSPSTA
jgi:DNA-binding winged helix-turn-helix (wHTH) protein